MSGPSSVQNVLDRMLMKGPAASEEHQEFHPSSTWQGPKPGYYFGSSDKGTGYYLDRPKKEEAASSLSSSNVAEKPRRGVQIDESNNEMRLFTSPESLLEQAERKASGSTIVELTPKGIQSAATTLDKLFQKNALQRAQYADEPRNYLESELALHDQLQALTSVATNLQLYESIIDHPTLLDTLTQLLGHDNDDIAATVVSLYLEWLDPTLLQEDPDGASSTLGILASRVLTEGWETIVSNFSRFQQSNNPQTESSTDDPALKGIENSLSLMENLLDLDLVIPGGIVTKREGDGENSTPLSAAAYMAQETNIVSWLIEQVEQEGDSSSTPNLEFQGRCIELVGFVAQREDTHSILVDWSKLPKTTNTTEPPTKKPKQENGDKTTSSTIDGIECMLQMIGRYRKTQPANEDETGLLENACLALSSCITFSRANLAAFLKGQGIELVVRCLKERVHSGAVTLKLLDFAGNDPEHQQACERLVTAGGFQYLFPLFLGTRIPKPAPSYTTTAKAKREWLNTIESQTSRIFYSLCRHLTEESPDDAKARFLSKFAQDETKCDRLVELLLYYDEKSRKAEYQFYRSDVEEEVEDEDTIQLAALDAKLKGGGDLFHRLGALAAYLAVHSKRCHERILSQLKLQQSGISLVKLALEEFVSLLGEGSPQRIQLESYLSRI